jgi:hypothetical protein
MSALGDAVATGATRGACNVTVGSTINNTEFMGECCMVGDFTHGDGSVASNWNVYFEPNRK